MLIAVAKPHYAEAARRLETIASRLDI